MSETGTFVHSSMFGSFKCECKIKEHRKDVYVITFTDPISDEQMEKLIDIVEVKLDSTANHIYKYVSQFKNFRIINKRKHESN